MGAQAVRLSNVDIDNALKNKDFEVLFQPIFDLGNGALARVESFVRWRHPSLGVLPPGAFISFFESQGRMSELTRYVLGEALERYCDWRGASAPGFSINLALSDLSDDAFAGRFAVLLRDRGFPADLITLECPMPPVTMDVATAAECFHRLTETGARLAIEVRGRANDFLRQIDPFPFDEIKTGGAAILRFARTVRGPGLSAISELLEIATKANAAITAVGVEDQASLAALRGLGFSAAQGNHLGKVGPLEAFTPSRVNDVRAALGLAPLSSQDLQSLFLTDAPKPAAKKAKAEQRGEKKTEEAAPAGEQDAEALVNRLAKRLARKAAIDETVDQSAKGAEDETPANALKAAAIARAKKKAAEHAEDSSEPTAARNLQEWLTREFTGAPGSGQAPENAFDDLEDEFSFIDDVEEESAPSAQAAQPDAALTAEDETLLEGLADEEEDDLLVEGADLTAALAEKASVAPEAEEEKEQSPVSALAEVGEESSVTKAEAAQETSAAEDIPQPEGDSNRQGSLAIKGAVAYFVPEMHISVFRREERAAMQAPQEEEQAPQQEEKEPPTEAVAEETPQPQSDVAAAAAAFDEIVADLEEKEPFSIYPTIDAVDLDEDWSEETEDEAPEITSSAEAEIAEEEASHSLEAGEPVSASAPARPRRPRKKNFFTRTVIPYPTHFWPRSWRRAWRRQKQRKEARRIERSAAE